MSGTLSFLPLAAGDVQTITPAAPGAGAEIAVTVTPGEIWILQSFKALFTAAAAVANRTPRLEYRVGGTVAFLSPDTIATTTTQVRTVSWSTIPSSLAFVTPLASTLIWPAGLYLDGGNTLNTVTTGLQGADTWTLIVLVYSRFRV